VASVVSESRGEELARFGVTLPQRGLAEGLPTPRPIGAELPAAFQEDEFCLRFVSALDDVLAPVFSTLDCWDSYLNARLAPDDFVDWLASWVGVEIDETWLLERRRQLIGAAVALYRIRGTAAGLAAHVGLYAGATPEIVESGGCTWSQSANASFPGSPHPHLTVRLQVEDPAAINQATVGRIVAASRPAHLPYAVEVVAAGARPGPGAGPEAVPSPDGEAAAGAAPADGGGDGSSAVGAVDLPGSERIELAPEGPQGEAGPEQAPESSSPDGPGPASPDGKESTE
jgi:phage tail-like protein